MGVPFNFSCSGFGVYVCARCGFELFNSEDAQISQTQSSRPVSFTRAIRSDSIVKMSSEMAQDIMRVACGKCQIPLGYEYLLNDETGGKTHYNIYSQSILFVPSKRCQVPLSFLF